MGPQPSQNSIEPVARPSLKGPSRVRFHDFPNRRSPSRPKRGLPHGVGMYDGHRANFSQEKSVPCSFRGMMSALPDRHEALPQDAPGVPATAILMVWTGEARNPEFQRKLYGKHSLSKAFLQTDSAATRLRDGAVSIVSYNIRPFPEPVSWWSDRRLQRGRSTGSRRDRCSRSPRPTLRDAPRRT